MKIGLIIHSKTGNTKSVALRVKDQLEANNQTVTLLQVQWLGKYEEEYEKIRFERIEDATPFDLVILGSPVEAFSLSLKMKKHMALMTSLTGKKVILFVTQHFPYRWMGGSNALRQMRKICERNNADVLLTGNIHWSRKDRKDQINRFVAEVVSLVERF